MNTRQALEASGAVVDIDAVGKTLAQRAWDQHGSAERAAKAGLFADAAQHSRYAADAFEKLHQYEEAAVMSRCTVAEAPDETLVGELIKRAERGETDAKKAILDAAKRLTQPKRKGESRVRT